MYNRSTNEILIIWLALIVLSSAAAIPFVENQYYEVPKYYEPSHYESRETADEPREAAVVPVKDNKMRYNFDGNDVIEEAPSEGESINSFWWLNSGARLIMSGGTAKTVTGELPPLSGWKAIYAQTDPDESDQGAHPQNIFRLITRTKAADTENTLVFKILNTNLSNSLSRNESNGILLFSRYQDGMNSYYAGIRVDGFAVIKKKLGGTYYTLGLARVFGEESYGRYTKPNFIPKYSWLGLKAITKTEPQGGVVLQLFIDKRNGKGWEGVLEVRDYGKNYGPVINNAGSSGIRTDFMDVEFDSFELKKL